MACSIWICWAFNKHLGSQTYNFWGSETLEISAFRVRVHLEIIHLVPGHTGRLWKSLKFKSVALNWLRSFNHTAFLEALHSGVLQLGLLLSCIAININSSFSSVPICFNYITMPSAAGCIWHRNAVLLLLGCQREYIITKINNV